MEYWGDKDRGYMGCWGDCWGDKDTGYLDDEEIRIGVT